MEVFCPNCGAKTIKQYGFDKYDCMMCGIFNVDPFKIASRKLQEERESFEKMVDENPRYKVYAWHGIVSQTFILILCVIGILDAWGF